MNNSMKLSEAIRKGSEGRKQVKEKFIDSDTYDVCALGAAYVGFFGKEPFALSEIIFGDLAEEFPVLGWGNDHGFLKTDLTNQIIIWNDEEGLTFEEIAARLEEMGQ